MIKELIFCMTTLGEIFSSFLIQILACDGFYFYYLFYRSVVKSQINFCAFYFLFFLGFEDRESIK